jgi:hypothetical protein
LLTLEGLNDDHRCATLRTDIERLIRLVIITVRHCICECFGIFAQQQLTCPCQILPAFRIGIQSIMADMVEAFYALQRIKGLELNRFAVASQT